jgi:hypothetical protein
MKILEDLKATSGTDGSFFKEILKMNDEEFK